MRVSVQRQAISLVRTGLCCPLGVARREEEKRIKTVVRVKATAERRNFHNVVKSIEIHSDKQHVLSLIIVADDMKYVMVCYF